MGSPYSSRQSTLHDGNIITAALFNNEYNALLNAFAYASTGTTGHQHDGTAGEGGNVHTIGDQDFLNKVVVESDEIKFFIEVSAAAVEQMNLADGVLAPETTNDIDLGTSSKRFKTIYGTTLDIGGTAVNTVRDEDNMASDDADGLATQQSIKAYVDATVAATNEVVEDASPQLGGDLDLNSNDITGTGDISHTGTLTSDKLMVDLASSNSSIFTNQASTDPHMRFRAGFSGGSQYSHWTQLSFEDSGGNVRGSVTSNSFATIYATSSDYRLKEDIQAVPNATARTLELKPCNFQWIGSTQRMDGFLAHELAEQVPEAVTGEKDAVDSDGNPTYQGIDQSKIVPLLVATIQELEARITELENA